MEGETARDDDNNEAVAHDTAAQQDSMLLTQEFPTSPSASSVATAASSSSVADNGTQVGDADDDQGETEIAAAVACADVSTTAKRRPETPVDPDAQVDTPTNHADANGDQESIMTSSDDEDDDDDDDDDDNALLEEEELPNNLSLADRRKRNMERNQAFLNRIGLVYGVTSKHKQTPVKKSKTGDNKELEDNDNDAQQPLSERRGMLLPVPGSIQARQQAQTTLPPAQQQPSNGNLLEYDYARTLSVQFPHRQAQIRKLSSLLSAAAAHSLTGTTTTLPSACANSISNNDTPVFIPAPIFVTGPPGTGKTSVVNAIVQAVKRNNVMGGSGHVNSNNPASCVRGGTKVVSAYTNCATLDVSSIDELVTTAFHQFQAGVERLAGRRSFTGRRRKRKAVSEKGHDKSQRVSLSLDQSTPSIMIPKGPNDDDDGATKEVANDEPVPSKKRTSHYRSAARLTRRQDSTETAEAPKFKAAKTRVFSATEDMAVSSETWRTEQTAVWAFGRTLASLLGGRHAGILVVDQAERLQSMSPNKGDRNNFLSQLLFLPRVAGINLTVIVVTNSVLLDHTRLNNLVPAQRSLGTIAADLQPIRIHFSAYKGKAAIKEILRKPNVQNLITGDGSPTEDATAMTTFRQTVFRSFLDTLVQSAHDLTSDINEFIRLGRLLWPKYTEPLGSTSVVATTESAQKALAAKGESDPSEDKVRREILTILDRRIFPLVRRVLQKGVFTLDFDVSSTSPVQQHDMPQLVKYLLLAAFICQHNRPDRDKHLFSIQKNGKRRRSSNGEGNNKDEGAFGSSSQEQSKKLRPRSFPLERMLSVYVSTIGLNQSVDTESEDVDNDERLRSLGTATFNESVAHLRDLGLLFEPPSRSAADAMRLNDAKYCCSLTIDEAQAIAKSLRFPIDRYIL